MTLAEQKQRDRDIQFVYRADTAGLDRRFWLRAVIVSLEGPSFKEESALRKMRERLGSKRLNENGSK